MILVREVTLPIEETQNEERALQQALTERLQVAPDQIRSFRILRESVDARKKDEIIFSYHILVSLADEEAYLALNPDRPGVIRHYEDDPEEVIPGDVMPKGRILIAGFGPAGMFCGLTLARAGYRPLIVERGPAMAQRTAAVEKFWTSGVLDPSANVQFGEGGAGTFSDGKLTTRIRDLRVNQVLNAFTDAGAPLEILYRNKPHVGTDLLKGVVMNIRREILRLGGEIRFGSLLEDLKTDEGRVTAAKVNGEWMETAAVILSPGHSSRDTYAMLMARGIAVEAKAFAVGLRVEHLQTELDQIQYGRWADHPKLRASEYSLAAKAADGRGVYSFCMCPGGRVVNASSEEGHLCVNGMSYHARDLVNANSAVVAAVNPRDFGGGPKEAIAFQRDLERKAFLMGGANWHAPVQLTQDFLKKRPSRDLKNVFPAVGPGFTLAPLHELLPPALTDAISQGMKIFGQKIRGFDKNGLFTGVETRTSAPLRILRDENLESLSHKGLYPCGEGAGYAGGIVSAGVDGIRAAEAIIRTYRPVSE